MNIGYLRVSTTHQLTGIERQNIALPECVEKVFTDRKSGKDTNREGFKAMIEFAREGDTVYFESFSRISRSLPDLLKILDEFDKKGIKWVSIKEQIGTNGASGRLIVSILGALAQYEREINAERREYGYQKAVEEKRVGRPALVETPELLKAWCEWKEGKIKASEAIKRSGVSKASFYRYNSMKSVGE